MLDQRRYHGVYDMLWGYACIYDWRIGITKKKIISESETEFSVLFGSLDIRMY